VRTGQIGYCGSSLGLYQSKFQQMPIRLGRKAKERARKLCSIWSRNLEELTRVLGYNLEANIFLYRISSEIFPLSDHPRHQEAWNEFLENADFSQCAGKVRQYLKEGGRITMHPKQFISLGNSKGVVRKKSIISLERKAEVMDLLGLPVSHFAPINIHLSNGRDGAKALNRFWSSLDKLSDRVRLRLVFENEDKDFWTWQNIAKCFPDFPITLDSHHRLINNEGEDLECAVEETQCSWGKNLPIRHISDGEKGPHDRGHHSWVQGIPKEFLYRGRPNADIEVEAKMKDLAVLYLKAKYQI